MDRNGHACVRQSIYDVSVPGHLAPIFPAKMARHVPHRQNSPGHPQDALAETGLSPTRNRVVVFRAILAAVQLLGGVYAAFSGDRVGLLRIFIW